MIIINHLPGILFSLILAVIIGLLARLMMEGAGLRVALISVMRFFVLPLAMVVIIINVHDRKRKIIFDAKESGKLDDVTIRKMEEILEKKRSIAWFCFKFSLKMYRPLVDAFIKASVIFEKERTKNLRYKKNKDDNKFFDFFLNESDVNRHLFHTN